MEKKYTKVIEFSKDEVTNEFKEGERIVVQEKLDGANASFMRDGNTIRAFSRLTELNEEDNLEGFYQFSQTLNPEELVNGFVYFGEFLTERKVEYPEQHQKKFFLFDIYNPRLQRYLPFRDVKREAERLGLSLVPVFYEGEYVDKNHLQSFVGLTKMGAKVGDKENTGEGVVVKHAEGKTQSQKFVKLLGEGFKEVKKYKRKSKPLTPEQLFAEEVITEARVEKHLFNLIDQGVLDKNYKEEEFGKILKLLNPVVLEDAIEEEGNMLPKDYDEKKLSKAVARKVSKFTKEFVK
ncbi:RNA ligase family protein [Bacillus mojavensis]